MAISSDNFNYVKSKQFAVRVVGLYQYLTTEKREYVMSKQLLRCGTSIGANIMEANHGISRRDFTAKMYIAYKECAETLYWLDLLHETHVISDEMFQSINADCVELYRILTAVT